VRVTAQSSLLLAGDVTVDCLSLAGSLQLSAPPGVAVVVNTGQGEVVNDGHELLPLDQLKDDVSEVDRMRGYRIVCREMRAVSAEPTGPAEVVFTGRAGGSSGLIPLTHFDPDEEPQLDLQPQSSFLCAPFSIFTRNCT